VNEVECEAAAQQDFIDALRGLLHVTPRMHSFWAGVEELRALADDDTDVGDGTHSGKMAVVAGGPLEVFGADLLPAQVFAAARLRAHEMEVGYHAARRSLAEPHAGFLGILGKVAPAGIAGGIGGSDVGGELAVEHGVVNAALQAAAPNGGLFPGATLVVGLKPGGGFAQAVEVGAAAHVSAGVGEEEAVGLLLFGERVVAGPQRQDAIGKRVPVGRR
jgi:hypothetical protein